MQWQLNVTYTLSTNAFEYIYKSFVILYFFSCFYLENFNQNAANMLSVSVYNLNLPLKSPESVNYVTLALCTLTKFFFSLYKYKTYNNEPNEIKRFIFDYFFRLIQV